MPGLGLANAYGAKAVTDELVDLIAAKQVEQDLRERKARQAQIDAEAREEKAVNRRRLAEQDERQRRLDEQAEKDKATTRLMKLAENFPGARAKRAAFGDVPADLESLILKPLDPTLASRSITGYTSMPGAAVREGALMTEDREAIEPGTVEIQEPESERRRIADARATATADKADKDRALREQQQRALDAHRERMAEIAAQRAAGGGGRRGMTEGQEFAAIDKLGFRYNQNTKMQREVVEQFSRMDTAMEGIKAGRTGLNPGTQIVINAFNRISEPGSVTRESEYARSPEGQSLLGRIEGKAQALVKGGPGMRPQDLEEFVGLARQFRDRALRSVDAEKRRIKAYADRYDIPMDLIVTDFDAGDPAPVDNTAAAGATGGRGATSNGAPASSGFRIKSVRPAGR